MTDRPHVPPPVSAAGPEGAPDSLEGQARQPETAKQGWAQRLSAVLFIVFCFELGLFLLIYPWTDSWNQNYFSWIAGGRFHSEWHEFWNNPWVRGAVSGLGAANLWIAMAEVMRLFTRRHERH